MRIRDYYIIGKGKTGELNKITDVPGIKVGHYTIKNETHSVGITAIKTTNNIYKNKRVTATYYSNNFKNSKELMMVNKLGYIETPIILTNTQNVENYMEPLMLNFISHKGIDKPEVFNAINNAKIDFLEGSIGAGANLLGYGGIGSASRLTLIDEKYYTIGVLVQSNFQDISNLIINGNKVGEKLKAKLEYTDSIKNSIVIIVSTDLPLTEKQLKKTIKKAKIGLDKTGFNIENMTHFVITGFLTDNSKAFKDLDEEKMNYIFNQVADATEEAILNSLTMSNKKIYKGKTYYSLKDLYLNNYLKNKNYEAFIENFPVMNQYPKYPVGCESVALYTLLKYYDINITVNDIIDNLKKGEKPHYENNIMYGGDPEKEFLGDPRDIYSYGVFEKPIMEIANKFKPGIKNISGVNFAEILDLVKKGYPVQVWISIDVKKPLISEKSWVDRKTNKTIFWKQPEHSLIIIGYSHDKIVVSDPNKGCIRELDRNSFEYAYNFFGKKALYYNENT